MRPATLADARKMEGAVPSVTTMLDVLAKPSLINWLSEEAIRAAFRFTGPLTDELMAEIKVEADQVRSKAASFGTEVHAGIAAALKWENYQGSLLGVDEVVAGFMEWYDQQESVAMYLEQSFWTPEFGGTADWVGLWESEATLVDYKTRSFTKLSQVEWYDEMALQLAGYAQGLALAGIVTVTKRISVVISREVPGLIATKVWREPEYWDEAWAAVAKTWQVMKRWNR